MQANAELTERARPQSSFALNWIISGWDDTIWFIGSVLTSYALFALYVSGVLPLFVMVLGWAVLIDGPHVFGTFSRTYFDKAERAGRRRLLLSCLLFFLVGPAFVLLGQALLFFFLAALWAYYHVVKQHYGFMVLYKKKNADLDPVDNYLDRGFLLLAFTYPFVAFIRADAGALQRVPPALHSSIDLVARALLLATAAAALLWAGRQVWRWTSRQPLNLPKYLLLAAAIPMHWVVLLTPMPNKAAAVGALLTIYHNLQYHRLVWFHNRKYRAEQAQSKFGFASTISRNLASYVVFGVLFGLWYQAPRTIINFKLGQTAFWPQLVLSLFWGYAFIHYQLDAKIWRVRHDPAVGQALNIS
jgi:hypothetical protein